MIQRYPPDDPREWLNRARSDLALARTERPDVYLEDLCFHAQQAVEKAVKALLIAHQVDFPYTHDIAQLLTLLENAGPTSSGTDSRGGKANPVRCFCPVSWCWAAGPS